MTNTLNRRQAMTGVASIAASATIATTALAGTTDLVDQHLIDLFTKWQGLQREKHAALDKWEADKKSVHQRHKVPALLQALADITAKQKAVEIELINTSANGLTGVQVKLSFWAYWNFDDGIVENDFVENYPYPESHAIKHALIDLQRLTGQTIKATA